MRASRSQPKGTPSTMGRVYYQAMLGPIVCVLACLCPRSFEAQRLRRARDTQGAVGVPAPRSGAGMER